MLYCFVSFSDTKQQDSVFGMLSCSSSRWGDRKGSVDKGKEVLAKKLHMLTKGILTYKLETLILKM